MSKMLYSVLLLAIFGLGAIRPAHAQFAVIDVASIVQLVQQVQELEQQVQTAQSQLSQAQAEYASITGTRGMQSCSRARSAITCQPTGRSSHRL